VPFVDLDRIHAPIRAELEQALIDVSRRGDFILGDAVVEFEREFAAYVGCNQAIGVSSGTAAITIALAAAGIGPGDEVIVPAHTYVASAMSVVHAGAAPVFCDVDERTGLIDVESAAAATTSRTAAVIPVHLYGQLCDMAQVLSFADGHGLAVIEDAAQAHGASYRGVKAGAWGLASAFSFYPSKNLGCFGDGGIVCTDDSAVADRARQLRNLGQLEKGDHRSIGFNERLHTLQAAVLRVKLPRLDDWNRDRSAAARTYREQLPAAARCLPDRADFNDVHHLAAVRLRDRGEVARLLAEQGIETGIHYALPVHRHPPFKSAPRTVSLERAEAWAEEELSLPMFAGITEPEMAAVCSALQSCEEIAA
jgi:dTDP-4-amino-4,6-dideoxygalactose transaminase